MLKLILLSILQASSSIDIGKAPKTITLINGQYTKHQRQNVRNQITCEDYRYCPIKIICSRKDDLLNENTKWNCHVFGEKNQLYDYLIGWEGSNQLNQYNEDTFYAKVKKNSHNQKDSPIMNVIYIIISILTILIGFYCIIQLGIFDIILVVFLSILGSSFCDFGDSCHNEWTSNENVGSHID